MEIENHLKFQVVASAIVMIKRFDHHIESKFIIPASEKGKLSKMKYKDSEININ